MPAIRKHALAKAGAGIQVLNEESALFGFFAE
jgi:hypothetical protein